MNGFTKIVAAALLATSALPLIAPPSEAAIVRRHLHCSIGDTVTLPGFFLGNVSSTPFVVTNQWSFAIPANTTYTLRAGKHSWTVKNKNALGAGGSFAVNAKYSDGVCDVTVPG